MNGINWKEVLPQLEGLKDAEMQTMFTDAVKEARKQAKIDADKDASFNRRATEALHTVFSSAGKDILPRGTALMLATVGMGVPALEIGAATDRLSTLLESGQQVFGVLAGPNGGLARLADSSGKPTAMAAILKQEGANVRFGKVGPRPRKNGSTVTA